MPLATAHVKLTEQGARRVLALAGRLDAVGAGQVWRRAMQEAERAQGRPLALDLRDVSFCDMSGATLLAAIDTAHGRIEEISGGPERLVELLQRARRAGERQPEPPVRARNTLQGQVTAVAARAAARIGFIGEIALATLAAPRRRRMVRLLDMARYAEQAGARSLPLVVMLGYLMGLILAFQSAVPMRRFGADLFVANLVSISLVRELGPLLTAVILSGRTASAFAAEIGTMKVNEEVDALTTMGLHPVTMLVLPRMAAVMLVIPVMTVVLEIAGLAGMATVMVSFGFPLSAITRQVQSAVVLGDLFGGLFKSAVFGLAIAAIGCRAGLATGIGPRAVGMSATAAVVGGIVSTILLDGVFALIFYRLGL
jgi:phospholipid/cholesterol/gamma-HCH transport system permease protein